MSGDEREQFTRTWLIHPDLKLKSAKRSAQSAYEEACALAVALPELSLVGSDIVPLPRPHPGMLFGSGKRDELKRLFKENHIELVLIDGPVTPVQQRNLEKAWSVKILDRTGLILEIFSDRAATREGVLQVEMAALTYQRTRLVRAWTHLERQRGGLGFVGGPGETQIEADRRAIDLQLSKLRQQLSKVVKTRALHRASRAKIPYPIVALVGYTNAGKSTLFNILTGADVVAKDMLFATLDPCMRSLKTPQGTELILSDTVGFVSDLPTELVAAFRATLEEVLSADLVLHVRDISSEESDVQAEDVLTILEAIGLSKDVKILEVWNKVDLLPQDERTAQVNKAERLEHVLVTSAAKGEGVDTLIEAIEEHIKSDYFKEVISLSHNEGKKRSWLYQQGLILRETTLENHSELEVNWSLKEKAQFESV